MHRRHFLLTSVLLVLVILVMSCSDENPTDSNEPPNGGIVTTSISRATSNTWVPISGLPSDSRNFYGVVTAATKAVTDTGFAPIVRVDSGDYLITPLYPPDPTKGGAVQIVIADGDKYTSAPISFYVDSLPQAPGVFDSIVTLQQLILTERLRLAGLTRDSLIFGSPTEIPLEQLPYVLSYGAIDNPSNPNSLSAIANGTAPIVLGGTFDLDILERLLADMDLISYFQELHGILDTIDLAPVSSSFATLQTLRVSSSSVCINPPNYGITSCASLAAAMTKQYNSETASKSASETVVQDGIKTGLAIASLFPGVAVEAAAIGAAVWADGVVDQGEQSLLPSEFADEATSFNPSETNFNEDFMQDGIWTEFNVSAISRGWILDKIAIEAVLQSMSTIKVSNGPSGITDDVNGALGDILEGEAQGAVLNNFGNSAGIIEVCPNIWSNINCAGIGYSNVYSNTGVLDIDSAGQSYKPKEIGADILRIETKSIFGASNNTGTATSINASEMVVSIEPVQAHADTNKTLSFSANVFNADNGEVDFTLSGGGTLTAGNVSASVTTPLTPWTTPLILRAKSTSNSGLRIGKVDSDPRTDSTLIYYGGEGEYRIDPSSICIQPSQSQSYSIIAVSGIVDSVRWYTEPISIGTINPDGIEMLYSAPETIEGLISLFAIVNGKDTVEATIDINDCVCYWSFSGDNNYTGLLSTATSNGAPLIVSLKQSTLDNTPPSFSIITNTFNGAGVYDSVYVLYTDPSYGFWTPLDTLIPRPVMFVSEYVVDDYLIAQLSGQVHQVIPGTDPAQLRAKYIELEFRAEFSGGVNEPVCVGDSL
jgi:hypothetical protein